MIKRNSIAALAALAATVPAAQAQTTLDRVDPSKVAAQAPRDAEHPTEASAPTTVAPADANASRSAPITVGAITIAGLQVLRPSDFADIFEIYVGRTLSPPALAGLADALAQRAREKGFVLASASIPAQPLTSGILRVDLDEGNIDAVRTRGGNNRAVIAALQPLVGHGPVRQAELERRLLIAGDIDGLWLRRSRVLREGTRTVLEVDILPDPFSASVGIDNSGSRLIGPLQADLTLRASQLLADDDILSITELVTPFEPSEFGYLRARYGKRISSDGTEFAVSASYARTHPGSYLLDRDIDGTSWTARLDLLHPLLRRRRASLWVSGNIGIRTVRQDRQEVLARRDRLTVARVGLNGFADWAGGRLRSSATLSQGLDLFDATRAGDPLASRRDADGTFTTVAFSADYTRPIVGRLSGQLAVASQVAFQPLLVSEEVGLGGSEFLRAYDYSERSGDQGTMISGELRWSVPGNVAFARKPILYGFVDSGSVTNLRDGFGGGTLVSVGGGVRSRLGDILDADVGVAVPLSGERYDSGNADPVVNFRLTRRF